MDRTRKIPEGQLEVPAIAAISLPKYSPSFELYESDIGWAKSLEIVSDPPTDGVREVQFRVSADSSFLLVAVNTPWGARSFAESGVETEIYFPKTDTKEELAFIESSNTPELFAHVEGGNVVLGIMKAPQEGGWKTVVKSEGKSSFSFHMSTFNQAAIRAEVSTNRQMPIPFRCRACLATSKGLGASVSVAAGLAVGALMPAALVGTVGSYLSVGVPVATAFIGTVFKESSDGIAQKLCEALGLCERRQ